MIEALWTDGEERRYYLLFQNQNFPQNIVYPLAFCRLTDQTLAELNKLRVWKVVGHEEWLFR